MSEYKWVRRSPEWIKENPGKGTMYKEYISKECDDSTSKSQKRAVITLLKQKPIEPPPKWTKHTPPEPKKGTKDAGLYAIICEANKWAYIGQSMNVGSRLRNHKMIIVHNYKSESKVYEDIKKDKNEFGIESFSFVKIKDMPEATSTQLLDAETKMMIEYLENGYSLYNRDHCNNMYCSPNIKPLIVNLIKAVKNKPELIDVIESLIND